METGSDSSCSSPPHHTVSTHLNVPTPFTKTSLEAPVDLSINTNPNVPMYPYFPLPAFAKHHPLSPTAMSKHSRYLHSLSMDKLFGSSGLYPHMVARSHLLSVGHGGPIFPNMLDSGAMQESLQESSARLLFIIVHWLKNVPSFMSLTNKEKVGFHFTMCTGKNWNIVWALFIFGR